MKAERLSPPANVIGSGLLARAFSPLVSGIQNAVCVYAAGISHSSCADAQEFKHKRQRLEEALKQFLEPTRL